MKSLINKRKNGIEPVVRELVDIRQKCAYCKNGAKGIYKADAILTALELHEKIGIKNRNNGKKPVLEKRFGTAVCNLRSEGKSIREIAKILGISKDTVQKIIKNVSN